MEDSRIDWTRLFDDLMRKPSYPDGVYGEPLGMRHIGFHGFHCGKRIGDSFVCESKNTHSGHFRKYKFNAKTYKDEND